MLREPRANPRFGAIAAHGLEAVVLHDEMRDEGEAVAFRALQNRIAFFWRDRARLSTLRTAARGVATARSHGRAPGWRFRRATAQPFVLHALPPLGEHEGMNLECGRDGLHGNPGLLTQTYRSELKLVAVAVDFPWTGSWQHTSHRSVIVSTKVVQEPLSTATTVLPQVRC
jgi:hypothetical protein